MSNELPTSRYSLKLAPAQLRATGHSKFQFMLKHYIPGIVSMVKTVLELDLVGYSTIADTLEQGLSVETSPQLNKQIQGFIDVGLQAIGVTRESTVMQTTGDGAILVFDQPTQAHIFAYAVQQDTRMHNNAKKAGIGKRVFRIGIATGDLVMEPKASGGYDIAGMTIARAVRLEAKANPGEVLCDPTTFKGLSAKQRKLYAAVETITGKRDETFEAHRCLLNPDGGKDAKFFTDTKPSTSKGVEPKPISAKKPRIVNFELTLEQDLDDFDEPTFFNALEKIGVNASKIIISSIRPGSVILTLGGDDDEIEGVKSLLAAGGQKVKQFSKRTRLTLAVWESNGQRQERSFPKNWTVEKTEPPRQRTRSITPRKPSKCKVVLFAANPEGTNPLGLDKEVREIDAKIRSAKYRDNIQLVSKWAVRPDDLIQTLSEHQPQVVHFSGHGSEGSEIILQDANGKAKTVSKAAISALFRTMKDNIRLVVLNACFSLPQAQAIIEHIDCAIGMDNSISDDAAIAFAASFYRAIGFGKSVQRAFEEGKIAIQLEGIPDDLVPQLLTKKGVRADKIVLVDSVICTLPKAASKPNGEKPKEALPKREKGKNKPSVTDTPPRPEEAEEATKELRKKAVAALKRSRQAADILAAELQGKTKLPLDSPDHETRCNQIVLALTKVELLDAVDALVDGFKTACNDHGGPAEACAVSIRDVCYKLVPGIYRKEDIRKVKARVPENSGGLISLQIAYRTSIELIMAGLEDRDFQLDPPIALDTYPDGTPLIPFNPEAGLDRYAERYKEEFIAHLLRKDFVSKQNIPKDLVAKVKWINGALQRRRNKKRSRYYYIYSIPEEQAERNRLNYIIDDLHSMFSTIVFVGLEEPSDQSTEEAVLKAVTEMLWVIAGGKIAA